MILRYKIKDELIGTATPISPKIYNYYYTNNDQVNDIKHKSAFIIGGTLFKPNLFINN